MRRMKKGKPFIPALLSFVILISCMFPGDGLASAQENPAAGQTMAQEDADSPHAVILDSRTMELAQDAIYRWTNMEIGRGLQKVHSVEFNPSSPYLELQAGTTDGKVYGMQGVTRMADDADREGNRVIAATNADFYDLSTGIPLGIFIGDGTILNTPSGKRTAFGVKADGTAIIGQPEEGEGTVYVVGGSSGPKFYGLTERPWQQVVFDEQTQIYSVIEIDGDQLKLTAKTVNDGRYVDEFILVKGPDVPDPTLSRIELKGVASEMLAGSTAQAVVEAVYSDGSRMALTEGVTFASSDESVAKVDASGLVTALGQGDATITAEYEALRAEQLIRVVPFMTLVEGFEDTAHLEAFQVNANSVSIGLVERPETIYHGYHAVKLSYDFTGKTGTSAAYIRLKDPETGLVGRKLEGLPKRLGVWVYGDGGNHWLRAELQDAAGNKTPVDFTTTTGLNWNGWKYVTAAVPGNLTAPVQINQIYVAELRADNKNAGELYFDQLSAFYTDSPVFGLDLAGLVPMQTGDERQIKVLMTLQNSTEPEVTTDEPITLVSSDEAVASVGADGTIRAAGPGTANIEVYYEGMRVSVHPVWVTEEEPALTELLYSAPDVMTEGDAHQIRLYAIYDLPDGPEAGYGPVEIFEGASFSSSDPSVAAVSPDGILQAVTSGAAQITIEYEGMSRTFALTVEEPVPVLQSIQMTALPAQAVGESSRIKVYGIYSCLPDPVELTEGVTFSSSRPEVAAIDETGTVTALEAGTTRMTATYEGKNASFTLPVILDRSTPKREMRAAWIATVDNIDWPKKGVVDAEQQKRDFIALLDELQETGINAVIVQIKPTADAFYPSELAPWSEWLTGEQGKDPGYNPLAFMIEEVHKRNMEFHAWFNPYRVSLQGDMDHLVEDHPAREIGVVEYGGKLYFDPGNPEAQEYIIDSIMEVVENYDIDAVHFDDYFYPYPVSGVDFPDEETYQQYKGDFDNKADWRRNNVNTFLKRISQEIKLAKPHVKFGISPFGIWKNKSQDPAGSDTNGLSSYEAIFADSKKWVEDEEILLDYIAPQIYWNFGYSPAAYEVLVEWWSNVTAGRNIHLYTGNALYKVGTTSPAEWMNPEEMPNQVLYNRNFDEVKGELFFSSKWFHENLLGFTDRLADDLYAAPALVPAMPWIDSEAPDAPVLVSATHTDRGTELFWKDAGTEPDVTYYVIYRFEGDQAGSLDDPRNILDTVRKLEGIDQIYLDRSADPEKTYTYVITAADRLHNESAASNSVTADKPVPVPLRIELSGLDAVMTIGEEAQTVTTAVYSDGSRIVLTEGVTFRSSNEAVAVVDANGLVKAVGEGTAEITALYEGLFASQSVKVEAGKPEVRLERIEISGLPSRMKAGEQAQTVVEAVYSDDSRIRILEGVTFSISKERVAQIDASGIVKTLRPGRTVITATYGTLTDSLALVVTPGSPGKPEKPGKPDEPGKPDRPGKPDKPGNPSHPKDEHRPDRMPDEPEHRS
mgnify:CR=1 FL=1